MKKLILILISSLLVLNLSAQQIPEFQTTIYLEDTLGNRDSVIVGYDANETLNFINPNFGEVDITNVPWDSTFEARVVPRITDIDKQSKKHIERYTCDNTTTNNFTSVEFMIAIRLPISYSPLIVRWNHTDFSDDLCRSGSLIVESPNFFITQNPTTQGFGEIYLMNRSIYGTLWNVDGYPSATFTGIDQKGDTVLINALVISIAKNYPVSTNNQKQIQQQTKTFPNPTSDKFTIQLPENYESESLQVFDITGRQIYQNTEQNNQIEVPSSAWAKGIYFYQVELKDGLFVNGKIVKQ